MTRKGCGSVRENKARGREDSLSAPLEPSERAPTPCTGGPGSMGQPPPHPPPGVEGRHCCTLGSTHRRGHSTTRAAPARNPRPSQDSPCYQGGSSGVRKGRLSLNTRDRGRPLQPPGIHAHDPHRRRGPRAHLPLTDQPAREACPARLHTPRVAAHDGGQWKGILAAPSALNMSHASTLKY